MFTAKTHAHSHSQLQTRWWKISISLTSFRSWACTPAGLFQRCLDLMHFIEQQRPRPPNVGTPPPSHHFRAIHLTKLTPIPGPAV